MEIHVAGKVSLDPVSFGHDIRTIINAEVIRPDLLIDEIINDKGIDYVLNAIGGDAILKYITSKG